MLKPKSKRTGNGSRGRRPAVADVEVRQHRWSAEHSLCLVTTRRGYVYCITWAGVPTKDQVLEAWATDRKAFDPYYG